MDKENLDRITNRVATLFCDPATFYEPCKVPDLIDTIASLHNLLYEEVTGQRYDYMFHWSNKAGYYGVLDNIFDEEVYK